MTKQDILDYFSLIDFAYNESGRLETLSRMLDKLLEEQEPSEWVATEDIAFYGIRNGEAQYRKHYTYRCRECGRGSAIKEKYCPSCGAKMQGSVNADQL